MCFTSCRLQCKVRGSSLLEHKAFKTFCYFHMILPLKVLRANIYCLPSFLPLSTSRLPQKSHERKHCQSSEGWCNKFHCKRALRYLAESTAKAFWKWKFLCSSATAITCVTRSAALRKAKFMKNQFVPLIAANGARYFYFIANLMKRQIKLDAIQKLAPQPATQKLAGICSVDVQHE